MKNGSSRGRKHRSVSADAQAHAEMWKHWVIELEHNLGFNCRDCPWTSWNQNVVPENNPVDL
jgi:hypothetical protein